MISRGVLVAAIALEAGLWGSAMSDARGADVPTSILVSNTLSQWSITRECSYTTDTEKFLVATMLEAKQELVPSKIQPAMESYLDWVTLQSFGPLRSNCVVSVDLLRQFSFDPVYGGPRTGYLTVDGTKKGAEIYLNGQLKGNISTRFALSPGQYRVQTMKCDEMVTINPDDRKRVYCDKT